MPDTQPPAADIWTSVSYISTHTDSTYIYANGLNMIAVDVTIQATIQSNDNMLASDDELKNAFTLID